MKRRQRYVRAGLLSTVSQNVRGAETLDLVEGNTGDGATGEPSSGPAVSKNPCTHAHPSSGPGRGPPRPGQS